MTKRFEGELSDEIFKEFYGAAPGYIESREVLAGAGDAYAALGITEPHFDRLP